MARKLVAVAFSLGCLHAGSLMALGLGDIELESFLNQPLKASVDLLNMGGVNADDIKIRLGTSDDFDKLGIERAHFLTSIKFEVIDNGSGGARIVMSSEEPVLEPYLDFIVEARWPSGRLLREYTVLVDPPAFSQATQVVSASQRVAEVEGIAAPEKKNEVASGETVKYQDDANIGAWGREPGASGGTYRVRDSSAASPQRDYRAANTGSLAPGSRYTINKDQTLWDIASRAKPAGATVHQTMLEIQRLNPDAFINGNINRIKAGYTIYLPNAGDITSTDMSATLAEVNEQNAAWREGRDAQLNSTKRASLRISAEPEESAVIDSAKTTTPPATGAPLAEGADTPSASSVAAESANTASADSKDPQERLAAIEEQLASLQRIVSLKDDQIASLQGELAKAGVATTDTGTTIGTTTGTAPVTAGNGDAPVTAAIPDVSDETATAEDTANSGAESVSEGAPKTEIQEPTSPEVPQAVPSGAPESVSDSGWMNYLVYVLGALALGLAGLVIAKRRGSQTPAAVPARKVASKEDVFDDIKLRDQRIKPDTPEKDLDDSETETVLGTRGYGERKHDQYASDIDAADVLAEADIYIAYGRHQQAIDLLNNAIAAEPGSSVCRLKLLEIYTELNDHAAATSQMLKIKANGDPDSIERAESLIKRLRDEGQPETQTEFVRKPAGNGPGLTPNPLKMMEDSKKTHEVDFSGLEIEGVGASVEDDDLDLSGDFGVASADRFEDEELVIAADSNGLSTKLDLARAYLDMGDDDGARQILDEVVMEGSEELKAQARALLDRIG